MKYVHGDLIQGADSGFLNVIAHQTNCFCKGRRGIAPLIFEAYPSAKIADDNTETGDRAKLGTLSCGMHIFEEVDPDEEEPLLVFNLYGQYHWNQRSKEYGTVIDALSSSLRSMRQFLDEKQTTYFGDDHLPLRIGFPLIGCGLAGGDWNTVESLINQAFNGSKYEVYIYTLEKLPNKDYVTV